MSFDGLYITSKGRALQIKAQLGAELKYTRVGIGDGELGGSSLFYLNALKNECLSLGIKKLKQSGDRAIIGTNLKNEEIVSGFYFREIGVFALDPDIGEILYCYGNAGDGAEFIPPGGGAHILEKSIDVDVIVGEAANVSAVIESSLIFATVHDIEDLISEHEADPNAHEALLTAIEFKVDEGLSSHITDPMPHQFTDGVTTYKGGFKIVTIGGKDVLRFEWEAVV